MGRHSRIAQLFVCLCGLAAAAMAAAAEGNKKPPTGIDLFIEACHWQGLNPKMIRSGYAELETLTVRPNQSRAAIQKEIEKKSAPTRDLIKRESDPRRRAALEKSLSTMSDTIRAYNKCNRERRKTLFDGNDPGTGNRWSEVVSYDPLAKQWLPPTIQMRRGLKKTDNGGRDTILWHTSQRTGFIDNRGVASIDFQTFGRMQGSNALIMTQALIRGADVRRFEFPPEKIAQFKSSLATLQSKGKIKPFELVGETTYDSGATAYVVLGSAKTAMGFQPTQKYWIDPSRGYICPLIQLYDSNGKLCEEWNSSGYFLHEKSGLWFPSQHVHTLYNPKSGDIFEQTTYRVDPKTFWFNEPVSAERFAVQIPKGSGLFDLRSGKTKQYQATGAAMLSLAKAGLELSAMPALKLLKDPAPKRTMPRLIDADSGSGAVAGLAVTIIALCSLFAGRRIWRRKRLVCLLFCLTCMIGNGCSSAKDRTDVGNDSFTIEPAALDFGRVNETKGALSMTFAIVNHGKTPIAIEEIKTSCGCSVAEFKKSAVSPHSRLVVPIHVNIHGQLGKFENRILVKMLGQKDQIAVPLRGTVVQDLWCDSRDVVCSANSSSLNAEGTFDVHTADWPSVKFDWGTLEKGVSVREISRTSNAGETTIKFGLSMDVSAKRYETFRLITLRPIDKHVRPLVIRAACYCPKYRDSEIALTPNRISLGAISRGGERRFRIFGNRALIDSLVVVGMESMPAGIGVKLDRSSRTNGESAEVVMRISNTSPLGLFDGCINFASPDGRKYSISVLGAVQTSDSNAETDKVAAKQPHSVEEQISNRHVARRNIG